MNLTLRVGVAETTINPQLGMQIDGNIGAYRPAQVIINDLYARAIVFQQAEKRFLLLSMDLLAGAVMPWRCTWCRITPRRPWVRSCSATGLRPRKSTLGFVGPIRATGRWRWQESNR